MAVGADRASRRPRGICVSPFRTVFARGGRGAARKRILSDFAQSAAVGSDWSPRSSEAGLTPRDGVVQARGSFVIGDELGGGALLASYRASDLVVLPFSANETVACFIMRGSRAIGVVTARSARSTACFSGRCFDFTCLADGTTSDSRVGRVSSDGAVNAVSGLVVQRPV